MISSKLQCGCVIALALAAFHAVVHAAINATARRRTNTGLQCDSQSIALSFKALAERHVNSCGVAAPSSGGAFIG